MDTPCGDREYRRKMIIEVGCQLASATGFRRSPSKSVGVVIGEKKGGGPPSLLPNGQICFEGLGDALLATRMSKTIKLDVTEEAPVFMKLAGAQDKVASGCLSTSVLVSSLFGEEMKLLDSFPFLGKERGTLMPLLRMPSVLGELATLFTFARGPSCSHLSFWCRPLTHSDGKLLGARAMSLGGCPSEFLQMLLF